MNEQQAITYLEQIKAGGMTMGLARMERILTLCGNPHRRLRTVHIAGTNGKGSTARMIQAMGMAAGYRVGLFSSPAVTGVRDTICLNDRAIPPDDFARWITCIRDKQTDMGAAGTCSEFETLTAAAFGWMAEQHPDFCVIECGLGGAKDATNVLPPPLAAVLTPISLDHTAILGHTVAAIARQKCGIIKAPCGIVSAPDQAPDALGVIWETAAQQGLSVRQPGQAAAAIQEDTWGRMRFAYADMDIVLPLTGQTQCNNALTAIETVRLLAEKGYPVWAEQMVRGLATVAMPCRQEVISYTPLRVMDGAHNPAGIAALADTLRRYTPEGMTMLFGMLADKDVPACLRQMAPYCRQMICTTPPGSRALPADELAACARTVGLDATAVPDPALALHRAEEIAGEKPLLIGGSFYLCAELRPYVQKRHSPV